MSLAPLRRALRIARRDYLAAVLTKGFIIGLVLAPLMMCGGLIAIPMMRHVDAVDRRIVVLDHSQGLASHLEGAAVLHNQGTPGKPRAGPAFHLEFVEPQTGAPDAQRLRLADEIRAGRLHAFLEIGSAVAQSTPQDTNSLLKYYAKSPMLDDARSWLDRTINEELRRRRLVGAGVDPERVGALLTWVGMQGLTLPSRDRVTGVVQSAKKENVFASVGVPVAVILLMMILVLMGSAPLLQAVLEEKSQRIAEVLLGCASPWEIMTGKLLGGVGVTLTAFAFYVGTGWMAVAALAANLAFPFALLPWFAAFVLAAVLMYGAIALALGAACSDAKDAQQLQLPVMLPIMLPVMMMMPVLKEPNSAFATGLSLFPPFTPLLMVLRLSAPGGVPTWQPWAGLAGVLACTALVLWLGGRIFRVGLLMQGKLPKFTEILRWGLRG